LQLAHPLDEPAVLGPKHGRLAAGAHHLLGEDGHDAAQLLKAIDRLGATG